MIEERQRLVHQPFPSPNDLNLPPLGSRGTPFECSVGCERHERRELAGGDEGHSEEASAGCGDAFFARSGDGFCCRVVGDARDIRDLPFSREEGTAPLYRSFYSTPDTVAQLQAQSASGSLGDILRKARNPHTSASPALGHGEPSSLADALRQRQRSPPSRPGQDSRMSILVTGLLTHSTLQWRKT